MTNMTHGAMECDGPDQTRPVPVDTASRESLHKLDDSILLELAADVIDGWTPLRVDLLVEALRDRSAQFAGVEQFCAATLQPIWTPADAAQVARDLEQHQAYRLAGPAAVPAPAGPARGRGLAEPAGMRPHQAQRLTQLLLASAVIAMALAAAVLLIGAVR